MGFHNKMHSSKGHTLWPLFVCTAVCFFVHAFIYTVHTGTAARFTWQQSRLCIFPCPKTFQFVWICMYKCLKHCIIFSAFKKRSAFRHSVTNPSPRKIYGIFVMDLFGSRFHTHSLFDLLNSFKLVSLDCRPHEKTVFPHFYILFSGIFHPSQKCSKTFMLSYPLPCFVITS